MHGSQMFNAPFTPYSFGTQNSFASEDISEATLKKVAALQAKLNQKLGPEYISQRPGPGGGQKLTYAEGWKIINLANEVFGFNGWSSNLVNITTDFVDYDEGSKRYSIGVTAIVRVTLRDGVHHEDIGYGMIENSKSKGMALDKCKKEAVTDGLKRALRNFGNILGNCLYDKAYTQEVVKMKVAPVCASLTNDSETCLDSQSLNSMLVNYTGDLNAKRSQIYLPLPMQIENQTWTEIRQLKRVSKHQRHILLRNKMMSIRVQVHRSACPGPHKRHHHRHHHNDRALQLTTHLFITIHREDLWATPDPNNGSISLSNGKLPTPLILT
ncbi:hypothetical protein M378DRAFT_80777 [Amanita muscaria Koide BX008]|uniref:Uncharacterized protein n=1 Tax=Amanita muscaria (strain Koide BX008) TaxID=946122 RepID=A0A0C2WME5_AMAMK|nr:hypothetical protein M378DRAFT_80777 [Amanita muscaria Koide BX008]